MVCHPRFTFCGFCLRKGGKIGPGICFIFIDPIIALQYRVCECRQRARSYRQLNLYIFTTRLDNSILVRRLSTPNFAAMALNMPRSDDSDMATIEEIFWLMFNPPAGKAPNYDNPPSLAPLSFGLFPLLTIISITTVALRIWHNCRIIGRLKIDDCKIWLALEKKRDADMFCQT
jgi:hypothetical protein